jgi:hypothetical protein
MHMYTLTQGHTCMHTYMYALTFGTDVPMYMVITMYVVIPMYMVIQKDSHQHMHVQRKKGILRFKNIHIHACMC